MHACVHGSSAGLLLLAAGQGVRRRGSPTRQRDPVRTSRGSNHERLIQAARRQQAGKLRLADRRANVCGEPVGCSHSS